MKELIFEYKKTIKIIPILLAAIVIEQVIFFSFSFTKNIERFYFIFIGVLLQILFIYLYAKANSKYIISENNFIMKNFLFCREFKWDNINGIEFIGFEMNFKIFKRQYKLFNELKIYNDKGKNIGIYEYLNNKDEFVNSLLEKLNINKSLMNYIKDNKNIIKRFQKNSFTIYFIYLFIFLIMITPILASILKWGIYFK